MRINMDKLTNQLFIYLGLLGSILLAALFIEDVAYFVGMVVIMLFIGIISMLVRTLYAFALLITFILCIAFYNVGISWFMEWDVAQQGMNIKIQSLISFAALMAWMSGYAIQKNREVLQSLNKELAYLKKYDEHTGILTYREFVEQAEILFTGMKRRKENGFLLSINIIEDLGYKQRIIKDKLSSAILSSIRTKFDLAGQLYENSLILFLNNTNEIGMETVLQRIKKKLSSEGIYSDKYEINSSTIEDNLHEALTGIESKNMEDL